MTSTMQVYIKLYSMQKGVGTYTSGQRNEKKRNKNEKLVQACCMHMIDHEERNIFFQMFFCLFIFFFYELNMKKETSNYYTRLLETKGNKNENLVKKLVTIILLQLVYLLLRFFLFGGRAKNRLHPVYMYLTICVDILHYYYKQ